MTAALTSQTISVGADTPRVLVFGLPGGGKSALLGALGRVCEIQERIFGGRINDLSNGLRHHREQLYGQNLAPAITNSVYPLKIQPFVDGKPHAGSEFDVVLLEHDSQSVTIDKSMQYIFHVDAVLFVLDASEDDQRVEYECQQFSQFLLQFRKARGWRTEEPKLPLWLVLAKCDRLAKPGDNLPVWLERMEMRKEEATQRFTDVLKQGPGPSFGTLKFGVTATGVRQPLLTNALAKEDEPFGVAELFRDAIAAARIYRDKKAHGELNVRRLVTAAAMVAAAVLLFAVLTPIFRTILQPSPALLAVTAFRNSEGTLPAGHLAEPIDSRIERLRAISQDSSFKKLKDSDQSFVRGRLDELEQYRNFSEKVKTLTSPAEARNLGELHQLETKLAQEIVIPANFAQGWAPSEAGRNHERLKTQVTNLLSSANMALDQFNATRQEFDKLYVLPDGKPNWTEWGAKVTAALAAPTPTVDAYVASFEEVETAQKRWSAARTRLSTFREIAHAVGLVPGTGQTLLVNPDFKINQAPAMLSAITKEHSRASSWSSADVPDAALVDVKSAAAAAYMRFLDSGRGVIVAALGSSTDGAESPARLKSAVESAVANPALKAWNELARMTLRLAGNDTDPLAELTPFIRHEDFPISIQAIDLIQSPDNPVGRLIPTGSLILFVQNSQGQVTKKPYRGPDNPAGYRIQFTPADNKPLVYRAGSLMWAELGVTDASKADLQLTWWANGVRSKLYQFDRLNRPPRFHRIEQKADEGRVLPGVRLEISPSGVLPRVPDLLPEDSTR